MHLDLIARSVDGPAAEHVAQAKTLAALVISDIRGVVSQLRDSQVSPRDQIARFARSMPRPSTSLDLTEALDEAPAPVAEAVMRVVQEALANAARHGGATHAKVVVREDPEGPEDPARAAADSAAAEDRRALLFEITDDGVGAAEVAPGNGLSGMRERVTALGGSLRWESSPGHGFRIIGRIPGAVTVPTPGYRRLG